MAERYETTEDRMHSLVAKGHRERDKEGAGSVSEA